MIDTRAKRQSAAHVGFPFPPSILPTGTIDAAARAQSSWTYRGISIAIPVTLADFICGTTASLLPDYQTQSQLPCYDTESLQPELETRPLM